MRKNQGILVLILTAVVMGLLAFTTICGFGPTGTGAVRNIITGLDLSGGVSITYQAKGETPSQEDMNDTVYKLQKRVEAYSEEAIVYQEDNNRINVEIPGVNDANKILEELGKPGSLYLQDEKGNIVLEGSDIEDAQGAVYQNEVTGLNSYVVLLTMTDEGTKKFAEATKANLNKKISIVYDGEIINDPTVRNEITSGKAEITGMESLEAAREMASIIRIGSLKLELEELRSNVVGAQLGQEAIKTSLWAGGIGMVLVAIFMMIVYALPGVVAAISLAIYTGLELVLLNAFDLTLTLSGIAGIILSIGMAVDANVIIYARIREEIASGRSVKGSIKLGFQKATSAILDGNITTLISAAVLGIIGTGSIKGFAMTLALGIVLSMFTALVVARLLVYAFFAIGFKDEKFYGRQKERKVIDFVGKRKVFFAISIVMAALAPIGMGIFSVAEGKALNYSLEFAGGTSTNITFNEDYSISEIDSIVKPVIQKVTKDANIQAAKVAGSNAVIIKTRELSLEEREELNKLLTETFDIEETAIACESISPTISSEMRSDALLAIVVATIGMLFYIWIRFKDIRFASSAVIALIHDVLVVLAFYAFARTSVGNTFIACMLTIVGYSINATIVIFDRIRENMADTTQRAGLKEIVNLSITQTLTRSLYTSLTTFITIFVLFVLGVPAIREFALPIMVGIICGGYSSVCVTGSLWYVLRKKFKVVEE